MSPTSLIRVCLLALVSLSCPLYASDRIQVTVSIIPQKNLVQRIAGDLVDVQLMVLPGQSPATYEPTPRQMADLSRARLYYRIGVPFEDIWMHRIRDAYPALPILDARDGIELREIDGGDEGHDHDGHSHEEGEHDPHIWLSPPLIKIMALRLRDSLIQLDPSHRDTYTKNHARLAESLDRIDADIRNILTNADSRSFMVYHPSWGYFADAYGLKQIPIESEGKEPGARALAHLLAGAKSNAIGAIFVQRQFSQHQARAVASAVGARVVVIDPLSEDYPENLLDVAKALAHGL